MNEVVDSKVRKYQLKSVDAELKRTTATPRMLQKRVNNIINNHRDNNLQNSNTGNTDNNNNSGNSSSSSSSYSDIEQMDFLEKLASGKYHTKPNINNTKIACLKTNNHHKLVDIRQSQFDRQKAMKSDSNSKNTLSSSTSKFSNSASSTTSSSSSSNDNSQSDKTSAGSIRSDQHLNGRSSDDYSTTLESAIQVPIRPITSRRYSIHYQQQHSANKNSTKSSMKIRSVSVPITTVDPDIQPNVEKARSLKHNNDISSKKRRSMNEEQKQDSRRILAKDSSPSLTCIDPSPPPIPQSPSQRTSNSSTTTTTASKNNYSKIQPINTTIANANMNSSATATVKQYTESPQSQQHNVLSQNHHHRAQKRRSIGDWEFVRTIGAGSMGQVKLARNIYSQELCAVKVVPRAHVEHKLHNNNANGDKKESDESKDIRTVREAAIGKLLHHRYICDLYEVHAMTNHFYMLFEYVSGGQMLDYIIAHGSLKEKQARTFARSIASALDYCHRNSIVHRGE